MSVDLTRFVVEHAPLFVVTGAGCSTGSGIADYRDRAGQWKRPAPIQLSEFLASEAARRRYWARSMVGWPAFSSARPNVVHHALAALERAGYLTVVVTQNVDGLHRDAGQSSHVELHGNLGTAVCLDCGTASDRDAIQSWLRRKNPMFASLRAREAPDGDADVEFGSLEEFFAPSCASCGGILKPDVVFYGESVPKPRVALCFDLLASSCGVLALGSSLMVFSSFRFFRRAAELDMAMAVINRGVTRADDLAMLKLDAAVGPVLAEMCRELGVELHGVRQ